MEQEYFDQIGFAAPGWFERKRAKTKAIGSNDSPKEVEGAADSPELFWGFPAIHGERVPNPKERLGYSLFPEIRLPVRKGVPIAATQGQGVFLESKFPFPEKILGKSGRALQTEFLEDPPELSANILQQLVATGSLSNYPQSSQLLFIDSSCFSFSTIAAKALRGFTHANSIDRFHFSMRSTDSFRCRASPSVGLGSEQQ